MAQESQEVLIEVFEAYVAPVATAFPACSATPAGEWKPVGKQGTDSYSEAGATVTMAQTTAQFTPAGSPRPRKVWRTEHTWQVAFEVADMSPETIALLMNNATVTGGAEKKVNLSMGFQMHLFSLLLKGPSPLNEGKFSQFEVASCYQTANPAPKLAAKGGPAFLAVQFTAVEAEIGKWVEFCTE
jgi:hypothetical protein